MEAAWHQLPWDSRFFGVGIARVRLDGAREATLRAVDDEARAAGISCLHGHLDPTAPGAADALAAAQRAGHRLVEVTIDLQHPTGVLDPLPSTSASVRAGTVDDVERLDHLLELIAPWSRFALDPRFGPSAAVALHRAWVERAARSTEDRGLLVAEEHGELTALLTYRRPGCGGADSSEGRIDLIATSRPRSGAAQALVGRAVEGFGPGPTCGGPIAARNTTSLRFTEQLGYRAIASRYLFHRWLDERGEGGEDGSTLPP